jgi:hypothetical protein
MHIGEGPVTQFQVSSRWEARARLSRCFLTRAGALHQHDLAAEQRPAAEVVAQQGITIFGVSVWSKEFVVGCILRVAMASSRRDAI